MRNNTKATPVQGVEFVDDSMMITKGRGIGQNKDPYRKKAIEIRDALRSGDGFQLNKFAKAFEKPEAFDDKWAWDLCRDINGKKTKSICEGVLPAGFEWFAKLIPGGGRSAVVCLSISKSEDKK